jgi:hypothetical protein
LKIVETIKNCWLILNHGGHAAQSSPLKYSLLIPLQGPGQLLKSALITKLFTASRFLTGLKARLERNKVAIPDKIKKAEINKAINKPFEISENNSDLLFE